MSFRWLKLSTSRHFYEPLSFHMLKYAVVTIVVLNIVFLSYQDHDSGPRGRGHSTTDFKSTNSCSPQVKLVFMKTHKCASSTIENILFRHAYKRRLNVVVPADGNYLSRQQLFDVKTLSETPWANLTFHVFTLHNRWNYPQVRGLMGADAKYFTMIRDPADLFESLFSYVQLGHFYSVDLAGFIQILENSIFSITNERLFDIFGRNQLSWDLGLSADDFDDETIVRQKIVELERQFDLVLITERMEESIVLLQRLLCWPTDDVTFLRLNQRRPDLTQTLTADQRRILRKWLKADYMIYDHFRSKFDGLVNDTLALEGSCFASDVKRLQKANKQIEKQCVLEQVANDQLNGIFKDNSFQIMGYRVNTSIANCSLYAINENVYVSHFRESLLWRSFGLD